MSTINYNGMELEEFKECKVFDSPFEMCVWNDNDGLSTVQFVCAVIPYRLAGQVITANGTYEHCALLPDPPKPRMATWLEVARWCATGNGLVYDTDRDKIDTGIMFKPSNESEPIMDSIKVRKWSDTEWHEPTVEYLGIDDRDYNFNKKYGEV